MGYIVDHTRSENVKQAFRNLKEKLQRNRDAVPMGRGNNNGEPLDLTQRFLTTFIVLRLKKRYIGFILKDASLKEAIIVVFTSHYVLKCKIASLCVLS